MQDNGFTFVEGHVACGGNLYSIVLRNVIMNSKNGNVPGKVGIFVADGAALQFWPLCF